jgi:membrane fusion protein, multidrug efflux system
MTEPSEANPAIDTAAVSDGSASAGHWKYGLLGVGIATAAFAGISIGNSNDSNYRKAPPVPAAKPMADLPKMDAVIGAIPDPAAIVRGVVNPTNESTIASKMTARITAMPFSEGQSFPAGAVLARFDCSQIQAQLKASQAASTAYRKTYETNVELDQYEAVGKNEVAVSKANLGKAEAEAAAVSTQLSDCEVRAPFAGKVVEQIAHSREIAASGQPLLKIQSGRDVELELIVPSNWLTWMRPGAAFSFTIDETGNVIRGQVKRFGASVDPVSKTIRVTAVVTKRQGMVLSGMSGTAKFDDPRASSPVLPATPGLQGMVPAPVIPSAPAQMPTPPVNGKPS